MAGRMRAWGAIKPALPSRFRLWRRVAPGHFQRRLEFGFAERSERRRGPAAPAPGIVERRKRVGRDRAFERLLVGREFDVGAEFVGRERGEGDARLEGAAIEM